MGRTVGKNPAFQFYPKDWTADTRVLSAAACGVWINLICAMWAREQKGVISGTIAELARASNATESEFSDAIEQFERHNICTLSRDCPGIVSITCRRMVRDERTRGYERTKKSRQRASTDVVPPLSPLSPALSPILHTPSPCPTDIPPNPQGGRVWELFAALKGTGKFPNLIPATVAAEVLKHPRATLTTETIAEIAAAAASAAGNVITAPDRWIRSRLSEREVAGIKEQTAEAGRPVRVMSEIEKERRAWEQTEAGQKVLAGGRR